MISLSITLSVLRSSQLAELLPALVWYLLQFTPLIIAVISLTRLPRTNLRTIDRAVVAFLLAFIIIATASIVFSVEKLVTLTQSVLAAGVVLLLLLTYTRRWVQADTLKWDLYTLFVTFFFIQTIGLVATAFSRWPFDPDYGRYTGLFSNANYAGLASALGIGIGIYLLCGNGGFQRWNAQSSFKKLMFLIVPAGIMVFCVTILLSRSRGTLLAIVVALLVTALVGHTRKVIFVTLGTAAVGGIAAAVIAGRLGFFERDVSTDISSGRFDIYLVYFRMFLESGGLGVGYRASDRILNGITAHNIYLTTVTETGLSGLSAFISFIVVVIAAARGGSKWLLAPALTVGLIEMTESSLFGFAGPSALTSWLVILAFAASGRFPSAPTPHSSNESRI